MSHAECLQNHVSTALTKGAQRLDGLYYRCLRATDVRRLYRDDDGEFGFRVRPEKWRWTEGEGDDGLSVSDAVCARTPKCAVYFHPTPDEFDHVVCINLRALSEAIGIALVAVFDPIEAAPENPCHFVLLPVDVAIETLLVSVGEFMADDFPSGPKKPRRPETLEQARQARERYDTVFTLIRNVRET